MCRVYQRIRLGTLDEWLLLGRYKNREHTYTLELEERRSTKTTSLSQVIQVGSHALSLGERTNMRVPVSSLSCTGAVLWELDYPDAYIKQVYPYEDKVIIVWFWELGVRERIWVLCVEVPSGKKYCGRMMLQSTKSTEMISYTLMSIIGSRVMMMKTYTQSWMFILASLSTVGI